MRKLLILFALFAVCGVILYFGYNGASSSPEINDPSLSTENFSSPPPQFILHAGGLTPDGIVGSNSLEAVEHSYANGYRYLEIDFCWTEDGELVCVHDWDAYYAHRLGKKCVTASEFEQMRYDSYGFTSLTLDHLAQWMESHEDAVIVTDIKDESVKGAQLIAERYPQLLDSFCFQICDTADYDAVRSAGFKNIILTLYRMSWDEKADTDAIVAFAREKSLFGLTFSEELIGLIPNYIRDLSKSGVPLFVHTVNDRAQQESLFASGISGIYTDVGEGVPVET